MGKTLIVTKKCAHSAVRFSFFHPGAFVTMDKNKELKTEMILHQDPLWKGLLQLSLPVFLMSILKTLHDLVDGFFLGRVPDVDGVSISTQMQTAVGLTWSVFFIFISFGTGLSVAGNALIGQSIGKNDQKGAQKYAANAILISLVLGFLFTAVLFIFTPAIMKGMGAQGAELQYAITYLRIRCFELPFLFLSYAFQAIRQSTGDTTTPVLVSVFSIVVNIILTPIMILSWGWGIVGAGVSTLIANFLMLPIMLYVFMKPRNGVKIIFKRQMFDTKFLLHLTKIAIPASLAQALQALGFVLLNSVVYNFGVDYAQGGVNALSAAYYIGNRINSLVLQPITSLTSVATIYIAQNIGAGNIPRAKKAFRTGMVLSVGLMTMGMLLIIPFREALVRIFNTNSETIRFANDYMLYLHLSLPMMGVYNMYHATFQGSGDTRYNLVMATIRLWGVRLPLVYLSVHFTDLGPLGVWYAMLISNIAIVPLGMFLYTRINFLPKIRISASETEPALAN
jgi:putative MATE family efflux protein